MDTVHDYGIEELKTRLDEYRANGKGTITTKINFQKYGKTTIVFAGAGYSFKDMESIGCRIEDTAEIPIDHSGANCKDITGLLSGITDEKLIVIEGPLQNPNRYDAFLISNLPSRPAQSAALD